MAKNKEYVTTNGRAVFYAAMWNDFRQTALNCGWALALHGSLANDMDIMAMAWTKEAVAPLEMIEKIKNCFDKPKEINITISKEINNRTIYTMSIWADFYLDINTIELP